MKFIKDNLYFISYNDPRTNVRWRMLTVCHVPDENDYSFKVLISRRFDFSINEWYTDYVDHDRFYGPTADFCNLTQIRVKDIGPITKRPEYLL